MAPDATHTPEAPQTPTEALSRAEVREVIQARKPRPALAYRARDLVEGRIAAAVDRTRADLAAALG
jgi:hypothetical protein